MLAGHSSGVLVDNSCVMLMISSCNGYCHNTNYKQLDGNGVYRQNTHCRDADRQTGGDDGYHYHGTTEALLAVAIQMVQKRYSHGGQTNGNDAGQWRGVRRSHRYQAHQGGHDDQDGRPGIV